MTGPWQLRWPVVVAVLAQWVVMQANQQVAMLVLVAQVLNGLPVLGRSTQAVVVAALTEAVVVAFTTETAARVGLVVAVRAVAI
jgi:hypothetical protein